VNTSSVRLGLEELGTRITPAVFRRFAFPTFPPASAPAVVAIQPVAATQAAASQAAANPSAAGNPLFALNQFIPGIQPFALNQRGNATPPAPGSGAAATFGQGDGTYTVASQPVVGVSGPVLNLTGTVSLRNLGNFNATTVLRGAGSDNFAYARGRITLQNDSGTVVLKLTGPPQRAGAPLPATFTYTVVQATGGYRGATADGTLQVSFSGNTGGTSGSYRFQFS